MAEDEGGLEAHELLGPGRVHLEDLHHQLRICKPPLPLSAYRWPLYQETLEISHAILALNVKLTDPLVAAIEFGASSYPRKIPSKATKSNSEKNNEM